MNNALITEAETINAGTKFIITDIAQEQVGEYTEKWFVKTEARQLAHVERRVWGVPLVKRSTVKRWSSHLIHLFFVSLSSCRPIVQFLFYT